MIDLRNTVMRNRGLVSVISLVIIVFACGGCFFPRPDYSEPGFVPDSAFTRGIVVGGVVVADKPEAGPKYAGVLEGKLAQQEEYRVGGGALVEEALGKKRYRRLLKSYRKKHFVDDKSLKTLASRLEGYRYIVFVHFDKSAAYSRVDREREEVYEKEEEPDFLVTRTATRRMKLRLVVYDLVSGAEVIRDREDVQLVNSKKYKESADDDLTDFFFEPVLDFFLDPIFGEEGKEQEDGSPPTPTLNEVVESGLKRVYRILATKERCLLPDC